MSYTGFLVVGVLADHLGTSRGVAGLLLGGLFARFPKVSKGKLRTVGLLPKPLRRPLIASVLALCSLHFLSRGEYVSVLFMGFALVFLLAYPRLRRAVFDRNPFKARDDTVIDGEFRERKD